MPTILLIDDDPEVRNCMGEMLARSGYTVICHGDGRSALELLRGRRRRVDLIITDYSMPGMDGIELVRSLREMNSRTPVVYMTGIGGLDNYLQARELGIICYVQKPVRAKALLKIVQDAVRGHAAA